MAGLFGPRTWAIHEPRCGRPPSAAARSRCASDTGAASAGCCPGRRRRASGSACRGPCTLAMCSSPCEILMLSTTVSMAGNVQRIFSDGHADLEGRVALGVERLGRRHAAGHPQQDAGVGGRSGVLDRLGGVPDDAARRRPEWRGRRRSCRARKSRRVQVRCQEADVIAMMPSLVFHHSGRNGDLVRPTHSVRTAQDQPKESLRPSDRSDASRSRITNTPGIGSPSTHSVIRELRHGLAVMRHERCVLLKSAQARMSGSLALRSPTSCTRTMSRSGR